MHLATLFEYLALELLEVEVHVLDNMIFQRTGFVPHLLKFRHPGDGEGAFLGETFAQVTQGFLQRGIVQGDLGAGFKLRAGDLHAYASRARSCLRS